MFVQSSLERYISMRFETTLVCLVRFGHLFEIIHVGHVVFVSEGMNKEHERQAVRALHNVGTLL